MTTNLTFLQVVISDVKTQACNFIKKESLAEVFSSELVEISKNTFSYRTPLVAATVGWYEVPIKNEAPVKKVVKIQNV